MAFKRADKKQAYLRMALLGPAGAGKSFTALRLAHTLAQGGPVAAFDTERRSLSKYADEPNPDGGVFTFDVQDDMPDFEVRRFIDAIQDAEKGGYKVLVIDSLSHAWTGPGGILEFVDARKGSNSNGFSAWRDATPLHNKLVDTILNAKLHIIATMRTKMGYVQEKDDKGRTVVRKVGLQPVQREGVEYEFDVIADMDGAMMNINKSRCSGLQNKRFLQPGKDVGEILLRWLQRGGAEDAPAAAAPPTAANTAPEVEIPEVDEAMEERVATVLLRAGLDRFTGDIPKLLGKLQEVSRKRRQPADLPSVISRLEALSDADLSTTCERLAV